MNAATDSKEQKKCEVGMVPVPTTSVDPWTVMVHLEDTPFTLAAVMRPWCLKSITVCTVLQELLIIWLVRPPLQRHEARSHCYSHEEIVQQNSNPTDEYPVVDGA